METHSPSLQVNCPDPQAVTFTLTSLETREEVQGSSSTREKSNMWIPNRSEASSESSENISLCCVVISHEPHQHLTYPRPKSNAICWCFSWDCYQGSRAKITKHFSSTVWLRSSVLVATLLFCFISSHCQRCCPLAYRNVIISKNELTIMSDIPVKLYGACVVA